MPLTLSTPSRLRYVCSIADIVYSLFLNVTNYVYVRARVCERDKMNWSTSEFAILDSYFFKLCSTHVSDFIQKIKNLKYQIHLRTYSFYDIYFFLVRPTKKKIYIYIYSDKYSY